MGADSLDSANPICQPTALSSPARTHLFKRVLSGDFPGAYINVNDQVTGMIVLTLDGVKTIGAAWDTCLKLKPGAGPDILEALANMVRRDIDDTIGILQSIQTRLLLY